MSPAPVPRWRLAAGGLVLLGLAFMAARLLPLYLHTLTLQRYVEETTHNVQNQAKSDDVLRTMVVEKADSLELPVKADNVQVKRSAAGLRIDVRYMVRVDLPLYTVNLHFYPGAGSH